MLTMLLLISIKPWVRVGFSLDLEEVPRLFVMEMVSQHLTQVIFSGDSWRIILFPKNI